MYNIYVTLSYMLYFNDLFGKHLILTYHHEIYTNAT